LSYANVVPADIAQFYSLRTHNLAGIHEYQSSSKMFEPFHINFYDPVMFLKEI